MLLLARRLVAVCPPMSGLQFHGLLASEEGVEGDDDGRLMVTGEPADHHVADTDWR